jgi:hypothetical protein
MKNLIISFVIIFITNGFANSQIKSRGESYSYAGVGYTLIFFTNSDVTNTYPAFNFRNSTFLNEVNIFYGVRLSKSFAIELSPSFIYTSSGSSDGFYFDDDVGRRFYLPNNADLFALPINVNIKFYPFTSDLLSPVSNLYIGFGGGAMYISEEFDNQIYSDNTLTSFVGYQKSKNNFWNENLLLMVGFNSSARFGYAVELGYRLVPLKGKKDKPLTTSIASNFNSVNLTFKAIFSF